MRHQVITAQLLSQAQAALDAEANQPRAQASITDRPVRQGLVWGASTLLALLALATVVSGLN
jgi:hypothetical protein